MVLTDLLLTLLAVVATGSIAYGSWLVYEPAGYIVGGLLLLMGLYFYAQGLRQAAG